ncbi:hypothetical protein [Rhizobium sp. Leaf386]|uniref:hypothetical protein n=1 Tax=Rhizobium sp. Leaf386 TaxID=1736359 RepID=UPI0007124779|nr:hypothetical protein [Rhizobium sp. Leaf386]KQS95368.1 hypothetical protein ASG50_25420 [Rhizobium sp. Leaf386]
MDLDATFGPCAGAGRPISAAEQKYAPDSLQKLTDETALVLKTYMDTVTGLKMPGVVHSNSLVIWIVDDEGEICFAMEELFEEATGTLATVRPRGDWGKIDGTVKLGHPSLIEDADKRARIGGELVYDRGKAHWEINNFSGRYGQRKWQTRAHLEAVAGKFNDWGISLHVTFGQP